MPWSDRDGTPYIIARILEFVSAGNAHKKGTNSRHVAKNELHVRLSLYYRPSDVSCLLRPSLPRTHLRLPPPTHPPAHPPPR
jgi:hypothetical protein